MTIRLRAHHLLCMLTFVGEGYNPAFTANYRRIAERLSVGEEIELVSGPDDICAPLLCDAAAHCLKPGPVARDEAAAHAIGRLLKMEIRDGARFSLDETLLTTLRRNFALGTIRSACEDCEWSELCSAVAKRGFANALVVAT